MPALYWGVRSWVVILVDEVEDWFLELAGSDPESAEQVEAAINVLELEGPNLGRPLVDRIRNSRYHHMKELRPGSAGVTEVRILFAFDPERQAILLVAGDKSGSWNQWYRDNIPVADARYEQHITELKGQ